MFFFCFFINSLCFGFFVAVLDVLVVWMILWGWMGVLIVSSGFFGGFEA